ncbi:unnamed protein product [Auanema sp. JU1783]|nr:unnamed protein product [Auanema sp. JU1783]
MACVSDDMTELVRIFASGMVPKNGISLLPTALLPIELRTGDIKGPFHINDNPSTSYTPLTLIDQFGKTHSFEIIEKDPILSRIQACADPLAVNAVAYVLDKIVQLVITKDIRQTETIFTAFLTTAPSINLADITSGNSISSFNDKISDGGSEKRYPCNHCGLAKFNSFENLAVHQQKYCKKAENNRLSTAAMLKSPSITPMNSLSQTIIPPLQTSLTTPSTSSLLLPLGLTNPMQSQNIVLLPIAQHNQPQSDLIQFLGPPQTIIPIAIGKQNFTTGSLVLQKPFCASIKTPPSINFSNDGLNVTVPLVQIDTPCSSSASIIGTALPATVNPIPDVAPSTSTVFNTLNITTSNPSMKRAHDGSSLSPMEISKRARHDSIAEATNKALASQSFFAKAGSSTEGEKPYVCSCGVTFSAMNTLKAHRTLYCKDVGRPDDHREPTRKLPSRCSQCSYEPQSISQLSLHIRNVHNDVQAYVCKECGYRGYSIRGIRGHMRSHPELECMKLDALLASYVTEIKGNDNNPGSETEVIVT